MEYDEEPDTDDDAFINDDEESCDGDDDLNNETLNNPSSNLNDSMRTLSVNEIIFIVYPDIQIHNQANDSFEKL